MPAQCSIEEVDNPDEHLKRATLRMAKFQSEQLKLPANSSSELEAPLPVSPEHPPDFTPIRSRRVSSPASSRKRLRFFKAASVRVIAGGAGSIVEVPAPEEAELPFHLCARWCLPRESFIQGDLIADDHHI